MNVARAGRNAACIATRRSGVLTPGQAASRQAANKSTSANGKGAAGTPSEKPPTATTTTTTAAPAPAKTSNNLLLGVVLAGAVGASYYVTIHKMKDQDFLGQVEKEAEEEAQVNLHKSGLKVSSKVVPDKLENLVEKTEAVGAKAIKKTEAVVSKAVEKVSEAVEEAVEEIKEEVSEIKEEASEIKAALSGDELEKPKKKGWRKFIFFGPRREG